MANKKINDLVLGGAATDTMQLETDIGGSIANKITVAQLSTKIRVTDLKVATTVADSIQTTNAGTDGLAESTTVITTPGANQFQLTNGTTDLLVTSDCTIDQDLSTTSAVEFDDLTSTGAITITNGTPTILFNDTNDDNYAIRTSSSNAFTFIGEELNTSAKFWFFTGTGDGGDDNTLNLYGFGRAGALANTEFLSLKYLQAGTAYSIFTDSTGTGVGRNVRISADGASNQILVSTDGNVSMTGVLTVTGGVILPVDTTDVTNPPTDAELDAAFGTPASNGTGWTTYLDDNGAGTAFYQIVSDGTNWFVSTYTKAV